VSFKVIMTTSVTRSYSTKQQQICKTKTKTKTDFLVSDRSCTKTDGIWTTSLGWNTCYSFIQGLMSHFRGFNVMYALVAKVMERA